jgi:hypothetical protein
MNGLLLSLILLTSSPSHQHAKYISVINIDCIHKHAFILNNEIDYTLHYKKIVEIKRDEFGHATHLVIKGQHLDYWEYLGSMVDPYDIEYNEGGFYWWYNRLSEKQQNEIKSQHDQYLKTDLYKIELDINDETREYGQRLLDAMILEHKISEDVAVEQMDIMSPGNIDPQYDLHIFCGKTSSPQLYHKDGLYFTYFHNDHRMYYNTEWLSRDKEVKKD